VALGCPAPKPQWGRSHSEAGKPNPDVTRKTIPKAWRSSTRSWSEDRRLCTTFSRGAF
jgi:hypothetical protein